MSKKFINFTNALTALCIQHRVQLCPDLYDNLQVWDLEEAENPICFPYVEDMTEGDAQ